MEGQVLIVDDDADIRNMIGIYLEKEGISYIKCENAKEALKFVDNQRIDLILLDVMMPEMDGFEACIKIRDKTKAPILFLSAKSGDMDKVQGLTLGADDYIVKPFHPMELIARVKAQLRRYRSYSDGDGRNTLSFQNLLVDAKNHQVWIDKEEIHLTPKEYQILEYLLENKGIVLSAKQIYEKVWKEEYIQNDNTIFMHISNIRDKIEKNGISIIKTVWGRGYKI